ncbi:MAG: response regulator [Lysobacterales bacterium]|nr:MAG: response regulator [Xanthomonadales bacterium]
MTPAGTTLLVVEDEQELREYLVEELEDLGYQVCEAGNGALALALLRERPVDLVLTDIMMPQLGGAGLYHATRRDPALAQLPFLFLTALSSAEMLATLPESEQPHILKKPVDYDELADAIRARLA